MTNEEREAFVRDVFDVAFADVGYPESVVAEIVNRWSEDADESWRRGQDSITESWVDHRTE